jgi:hypothetical protein
MSIGRKGMSLWTFITWLLLPKFVWNGWTTGGNIGKYTGGGSAKIEENIEGFDPRDFFLYPQLTSLSLIITVGLHDFVTCGPNIDL